MKLIFYFVVLLTLYQQSYGYERIKLKDVQALTFYNEKFTIGRKPIPQLNCVSGHCKHKPEVVQCQNVGFDGLDYQWKCNANLEKNLKFNKLSVNCEGYDYPNDPFIIAGSCGLEYSLAHKDHSFINNTESSSLPFWIFIGFIVVFVLIIFCRTGDESYRSSQNNSYRGEPTAPPPPPGFKPPEYSEYPKTEQQSSGPGFWSGLGAGALGGYLFGRTSSNSYTTPPTYTDYSYYRPSRSTHSYQDDCYQDENSRSSDTYAAEGFGGTKRR